MLEELDIAPVVILESESREKYLQNLYDYNNSVIKHITNIGLINSSMSNYYSKFSDIINMLRNDLRKDPLTVSNNSGLPMYSKIYSIVIDKKKSSNEEKTRDIKEISKDLVEAIYLNQEKMINSFFEEYQIAKYYQSIREIGDFDNIYSCDVEIKKTKPDIIKNVIEYCGYPISEMSCMTLYTEIYQPKSVIDISSSNIHKSFFNKFSGEEIENIYTLMRDFGYPGTINQTKLKFYFPGKYASEKDAVQKLMNEKSAYALELQISKLENLDVLVASSKNELKMVNTEDYNVDETHIWVVDPTMEPELSKIFSDENMGYKKNKIITK